MEWQTDAAVCMWSPSDFGGLLHLIPGLNCLKVGVTMPVSIAMAES